MRWTDLFQRAKMFSDFLRSKGIDPNDFRGTYPA